MDESLEALHTAQALFDQIGNKIEQIRAWNRIGVAYIRKGEMDKAIHEYLERSDFYADAEREELDARSR